ncbi:MAG: serine--tRNA ligase [Brevinema sp.]
MQDINKIAANPQEIKERMKFRAEAAVFDQILQLNEERKAAQAEADTIRSQRNNIAKEIGAAKASKNEAQAQSLLQQAEQLKEQLSSLEAKQIEKEELLTSILERIPNCPDPDVPVGADSETNKEVSRWGTPRSFDFTPLGHDELLSKKNMWEPERAARISGRGFPMLRNLGARLETAIINFMLDHNIDAGAEQIWPPFAVSKDALYGTGNLPKFEEDLFRIKDSDLFLNPTAEVALTNIYREEIIDVLPLRFTAYSPSFRKEAGSYGKDTKGLIRVHQFNKVELVTVCRPEESDTEHQRMLQTSEAILQKLELPYRVMVLSQGDMGFSAAKTYDIEVWLPSYNDYKEIASISNCRDFQARRMGMRCRNQDKKTVLAHSLNGSALAVGRTLVAIIENGQQQDGSIVIPKALVPYFKHETI